MHRELYSHAVLTRVRVRRELKDMTEEEVRVDRYNKFRKLGDFREFLVRGGRVDEAEARRRAAPGVMTKSGRWAEVRASLLSSGPRRLRLHARNLRCSTRCPRCGVDGG